MHTSNTKIHNKIPVVYGYSSSLFKSPVSLWKFILAVYRLSWIFRFSRKTKKKKIQYKIYLLLLLVHMYDSVVGWFKSHMMMSLRKEKIYPYDHTISVRVSSFSALLKS